MHVYINKPRPHVIEAPGESASLWKQALQGQAALSPSGLLRPPGTSTCTPARSTRYLARSEKPAPPANAENVELKVRICRVSAS